jgi:RHS repeat-associated protein
MREISAVATAVLAASLLCPPGAVGQSGDVVEYYQQDAIGNVRAVTNQAGQVIERHDYLPFGEEWCGTAVCGSATAGDQPKRFTGKERDQETGLDYFGARYYGSKIGRFTTTDPVYTWRPLGEEPRLQPREPGHLL